MNTLSDLIKNAFLNIRAEEELKEKTLFHIRKQQKKAPDKRPALTRRTALAFCTVLLILYAGNYYAVAEAAYISLDINPSMEISLNRLGRVVGTKAYNPEAEAILDGLKLRGLSEEQAVSAILKNERMLRFISDNAYLLLAVQADDTGIEAALLENAKKSVEGFLEEEPFVVKAEYQVIDGSQRQDAHQHGMSMGKYVTIQELLALEDGFAFDRCAGMSVNELKTEIEHCHNENAGNTNGHSSGCGLRRKNGGYGGGHHGRGHHGR